MNRGDLVERNVMARRGAVVLLLAIGLGGARAQSAVAQTGAPAPQQKVPEKKRRFDAACTKFRAGDKDGACKEFTALLDEDPQNALLAFVVAQFLVESQQDAAHGEPFARRAFALGPADPAAWNLLAGTLTLGKQYAEAEKLYHDASEKFPDRPHFVYGVGLVQSLEKRFLDARESFERAVALDPKNGLFHFANGRNYMTLRRNDEAEAELRKAVASRGHADAAWSLGDVLARAGKDDEAERVLREAMASGPADARWNAGFHLGVFLFERRRYRDAEALLAQATTARADDRDAWNYYARTLRALGKTEAAQAAVKRYQTLRAEADRAEEKDLLALIRTQLDPSDK